MAGLLAHGSLLCAAFPVAQWLNGVQLAAYSCGGSRGMDLTIAPRSLLIPEGNHPAYDEAEARMLSSSICTSPQLANECVHGVKLRADFFRSSGVRDDSKSLYRRMPHPPVF